MSRGVLLETIFNKEYILQFEESIGGNARSSLSDPPEYFHHNLTHNPRFVKIDLFLNCNLP